jgi:hypothetical protein
MLLRTDRDPSLHHDRPMHLLRRRKTPCWVAMRREAGISDMISENARRLSLLGSSVSEWQAKHPQRQGKYNEQFASCVELATYGSRNKARCPECRRHHQCSMESFRASYEESLQ